MSGSGSAAGTPSSPSPGRPAAASPRSSTPSSGGGRPSRARRPTTSTPTAGIWGADQSGELLTWLGVGARHFVDPTDRRVGEAGTLDGLVLLDLPDFDSREKANRAEAERVLALADVFVWVTDPQKYADARLHDDYVKALAAHEAVMIAVLNQADRLSDADRKRIVGDLGRLLKADGVPNVQVLATSATTGLGVEDLRQRLANVVAGAAATRTRLAGDVRMAATEVRKGVADREHDLPKRATPTLVDASAGPPGCRPSSAPWTATTAGHRRRWLAFTRWVRAFVPAAPAAARHRRRGGDRDPDQRGDVRAVLGRSSRRRRPPPPAAVGSPPARSATPPLPACRCGGRTPSATQHPAGRAHQRPADPSRRRYLAARRTLPWWSVSP